MKNDPAIMKIAQVLCVFILLFINCKKSIEHSTVVDKAHNVIVANQFVDAFYSFNKDSLKAVLGVAQGSQPNILFYQKWAECAHYEVLNRDQYIELNDSLAIFPVTVKDDLMAALKINFNVTDTFHLTFRDGRIRSVETASNDLDEYYEAKTWVKQNRPELIDKACEGIWNGGPTPCECVQGMLKGFAEYTATKKTR